MVTQQRIYHWKHGWIPLDRYAALEKDSGRDSATKLQSQPTVPKSAEILHLPPRWIMEHYRPDEGPTWDAVRADFAENHAELVAALADDIRKNGVREPLQLNPNGRVLRGHHRLLAADDLNLASVPVIFAHLDEQTYWDPATRTEVPAGPFEDDEPWRDRVFPVPAEARRASVKR